MGPAPAMRLKPTWPPAAAPFSPREKVARSAGWGRLQKGEDALRANPHPNPLPRGEGGPPAPNNPRRWRPRKRARARWWRWPRPRKPWWRRQEASADIARSPNPSSPFDVAPAKSAWPATMSRRHCGAHGSNTQWSRSHSCPLTIGRQRIIGRSINDWLIDGRRDGIKTIYKCDLPAVVIATPKDGREYGPGNAPQWGVLSEFRPLMQMYLTFYKTGT